MISETSSGALLANDCLVHYTISDLPFGGVGEKFPLCAFHRLILSLLYTSIDLPCFKPILVICQATVAWDATMANTPLIS